MVSTSLYLEGTAPLFVGRGLVNSVSETLPGLPCMSLHYTVSSCSLRNRTVIISTVFFLSSPSHSNELSNPAGVVRRPGLVSRWSRDPQTCDWHLKRQVLVGSRVLNPMVSDSAPGGHCIAVQPIAHTLWFLTCYALCLHTWQSLLTYQSVFPKPLCLDIHPQNDIRDKVLGKYADLGEFYTRTHTQAHYNEAL